MSNMRIYDLARACPKEAQKMIQAGKLKGKTDINPMWRIRMLTELFGPCGIGWKTMNEKYWTTPGAGGEVIAWCSIQLVYRDNGEWSEPVSGIGGSMLVDTQKGNLVSNDEAYKMAYTDAVSVACKALGFAADIYWDAGRTKYSAPEDKPVQTPRYPVCMECGDIIRPYKDKEGKPVDLNRHIEASKERFGKALCLACIKRMQDQTLQGIAQRAENMGVAVNAHDPGKSGF